MSADKYPSLFWSQIEAIVYIVPNFQTARVAKKYLKGNKRKILRLAEKHARIDYLSFKRHLFLKPHSFRLGLSSQKTVRFSEQIVSADKYPCIFSRQMWAIVFITDFPSTILH